MSLNITVSTTSILEAELAAINKKSLQTLDANIPASILLTIIGFVSAVGNVLTLLVIYKTKSLHTKCYSLIANLSITDFFVGGSYVVTGLKRFVKALLLIPETCNQVQCLWEMFIPFLSQIASINFATAICIDRLFAVSFPSTYKFVHSAYIISLNSAAWTYSLILGGFYFYKSSYSLILANCNLAGIMMQSFYDFQSIQSLVLSVFTTLIYAVVLLLLKVKLMRAKKQHKNMAETRKILDRATTMTLSTVMFAFLVTQVGSTICLTAIADLETSKKNTLSPIIRVLPVFNSGINFWIYLWRSSEFRSAFYILTGLKARSIQPQSTANSHHFNHPSTLPISVLPMSAWHSKA